MLQVLQYELCCDHILRSIDAMEAPREQTVEEWFGLFTGLGFFAAIMLLAYQAYLWLKEGQWTPIPISSVLGKFNIDYYSIINISWTGAQKIVVWLFDLPLSFGIVVLSGITGALVGNLVHTLLTLRKVS
jgi:hypothetical protein